MDSRIGAISLFTLAIACGGEPAPVAAPSASSSLPPASSSAPPLASAAPSASASSSASSASTPAAPPHFSYAGDDGPDHWGSLDPAFSLCGTGTHQSPIDLPAKPAAAADPISPGNYDKFPLILLNNGHTVQVNDRAPSSLTIGGVAYSLAQFHFHMPSEHTVAGKHWDAEIHFVHKSADGHLAVIGMLIKEGKANKVLADVIEHAPAEKGPEASVDGSVVDVQSLLPAHPRYVRYDGSLTTPPCTEGVTWLVVPPTTSVIELSKTQLEKLGKAVHAPTNRPVQALGGRSLADVKSAPAGK